MSELKDRIGTLVLTTYGLTLNGFEKKCGMSPTTLNKMGDGLSIRNLAKIMKNCPELDFYYLVTGEFKRDNPLYKEFTSADCTNGENSATVAKVEEKSADSEKLREIELKLAKTEGERDTLKGMVEYLTQELSKKGNINQSASL